MSTSPPRPVGEGHPASTSAWALQLTRTAFEQLLTALADVEAIADRLAATCVDPIASADWLAWKERNSR